MAKHDILIFNPTSSGFETNLSSNTLRIRGDNDNLFRIVSGSAELLKVNTTDSQITLNADITASGDISGSITSTGSFGIVQASKFVGDASDLTDVPIAAGTLSGSAQIASAVSGAFSSGFILNPRAQLSGSSTVTGSFSVIKLDRIDAGVNLIELTNVFSGEGFISRSAQIASEISGAFNQGFNLSTVNPASSSFISGSITSTGAFGILNASEILDGDASGVTITPTTNLVSGSAQIASAISGAFANGFGMSGLLSGSLASTASFGHLGSAIELNLDVDVDDVEGIPSSVANAISSSGEIKIDISGSFSKGFIMSGTASGSFVSASDAIFDIGRLPNLDASALDTLKYDLGVISSSAGNLEFRKAVSGAFEHGFTLNQNAIISGGFGTTASFGDFTVDGRISASYLEDINFNGLVTSSGNLAKNISGSFAAGFQLTGVLSGSVSSTASFARLELEEHKGAGFKIQNSFNPLKIPTFESRSIIAHSTSSITSSKLDSSGGDIYIIINDGSFNFTFVSGSAGLETGFLFSKKVEQP